MANLTLRQIKGSPLTITEIDGNFEYFTGSYTNTGTITAQGFSGSFTGSLQGTAQTASYVQTAQTASYVQTTQTASYVQTAQTASYVQTAQTASYVQTAQTASYVAKLNQDIIVSGSLLISGSIIPNTNGISSTSSFSLGSPTNAWKDIYVSNGTINFLDGAGNVQGTIGTGTNATVITGSLNVVPINPLTSYTPSNGTLLHKSYTTADCAFSLYDSGVAGLNPAIYWQDVLNDGISLVLPWDKKIAAYSLVNDIPVANTTV